MMAQGGVMKKILLIAMLFLFLSGCGQAVRESGFYDHDTQYKDWDHLWFSWHGYKDMTAKDAKESNDNMWWGIPVDYKHDSVTK
jgi:hypothetical protein